MKEADGSAKIIDVTNGSKDKSIQKVIDYIKKVLQDKIGKDKLGKKTYAYLKNAGGNCLLYVFAGVKQDKLDESLLLNENKPTADEVFAMLAKYAAEHPDDKHLNSSFFPADVIKYLIKKNGFSLGQNQLNHFVDNLESTFKSDGFRKFSKSALNSFLNSHDISVEDASKFVTP